MKAVLLVNLGTPESPTPRDVGRYLREFLSDSRVVDLPRWFWLPLLYGVIVPIRSRRSARAYAKVWTDEGSPLMVNSVAITEALQRRMGDAVPVRLAMRYGQPSVGGEMAKLQSEGVTSLTVLPLYPQYSHTTTGTVRDAVEAAQASLGWDSGVEIVEDYHVHPAWVQAVADSIRDWRAEHGAADRLVYSMHGIPERYVRQGDPYASQCCESVSAINEALGLGTDETLLTFQSRVGKEPWLQPYTDKTLEALPDQGVKRVQVICPGFAADCLETLEEIAMENAEGFEAAGGESLEYIPALNDGDGHVFALETLLRERWSAGQSPV